MCASIDRYMRNVNLVILGFLAMTVARSLLTGLREPVAHEKGLGAQPHSIASARARMLLWPQLAYCWMCTSLLACCLTH